MPELPEVETVRRSLENKALGLMIEDVKVISRQVVKPGHFEDFEIRVRGRKFCGFDRRGKYLLAHLDDGISIIVHLRMTGRWVYCTPDSPIPKHTHVIFSLSDGNELRFTDVRRFGGLEIVRSDAIVKHPSLTKLGVEPLNDEFTPDHLATLTSGKMSKIKALILDQTNIAGLGNIYADEALFLSGIHPERKASSLTQREIDRLHFAIRDVLVNGIANKGTSFRDYVDAEGQQGQNQLSLKVYGRGGQNCNNCDTTLNKLRVGGRTSVYCPKCQA